VSDFFEPPPPLEPEPHHEWEGPPRGIPVTIPTELIVARTEHAVVYLAALVAYPTGFVAEVVVLTDASDPDLDPFDHDHRFTARRDGAIPPGQLRFGFAFADGSKATNTGAYVDWYETERRPDAPVMSIGGGRGDDGHWERTFWVWPLPPPGPLELVCEWPGANIPPTRVALDGGSLLEAALRVT
jgi:hypothetical protein